MYLSKSKQEQIVNAFTSYGMWTDIDRNESIGNLQYSLRRQAEAILVLVDLGFSHHLESWAEGILKQECYANADYV
jgi:hypothetical protein